MTIAPFTLAEIDEAADALLAEGGIYSVVPGEVRGVRYDRLFAMSSLSLREVLAVRTAENADQELLVYGDQRLTVGEVWTRAMRFADWLGQQGVGPGHRAAIAMRNYPEWCIAYLGIIATGACVVPLNAWWQPGELREGLVRSEAKFVVVDAKRAAHILPCKEELGLTLIGAREEVPEADHRIEDIVSDETLSDQPPATPIDPDSDFCLLFTSGSTGKPKGALLTHRGVVSAILSWSFQLQIVQRLRPEHTFVPENPAMLLALPLFHVTASHSVFLLSYLTGRKIVFMYRWDAEEALRLIREEKITNFTGVPTMAHELIEAAEPGDLDTLVDITTGGAKRPETQRERHREKAPEVGASSGYGLTETNAMGTHITLSDYDLRPSATGRVLKPVTEMAAFSEDGERLPTGQTGEICVRGPITFRAYLADEEATRAAFYEDGWFRTGDLGYLDEDGFLFIVDRVKDLIIRGGENVSCLEVENALLAQPGVNEATVFAVPDETLGERVGAAIWSRGGDADLEAVRAGVAKELASFKVPERLWLSPAPLPRGNTGKIDKRATRAFALEHPPHLSA
ncbi:class I adenylate-forming enzyme family protein [Parvularcula oceani]|uniref:class I adenylate-forming enzyme family protein n=1 Tax=Parvularcula oceani TaxID=1247963 RepID=UPI0005634E4E|nr:class I adenylate-forming enzyme family protein [Parvularcula oceani]